MTVYPIAKAVEEAENLVLGPNRLWVPANKNQEIFINGFLVPCRAEKIPEIQSMASSDAATLNRFLREKGFSIELDPFGDNEFGVVSILDLLVRWLNTGTVKSIHANGTGREFPGVRIGGEDVSFYSAPPHEHPIAGLVTKSPDMVYMTMLDDPPEEFALVAKAEELSHEKKFSFEFGGLVFPMVSLDQMVNIGWLIKMATIRSDDRPAEISQALQQTKLRMNEVGARAESAAAVGVVTLGGPMPDHTIDQPFLIWIERPGLVTPLFVGHITEEDWSNPGDITS
ncbi:hypothetical protein IID24_00455 [Patescibacteria group bacterium]|nr:hypothetical protein [Patescibacteria group bacterium]